MTATIHALIPTAKLRCEGCGTLADAACGCGVGYLPVKASDAAAKAIAADRQASNVAIAEKIGVTEATVRRARKAVQHRQNDEVEKRRGRDGKMRSVPAAKVETFSIDEFDETDGVTAEMVESANAANRRRYFLRCAADCIRKAEQGAGLRDARGREIEHLRAVDFEALAELDIGFCDQLYVAHLKIAAGSQFARDVCGNIFRPSLGSVETDDPNRVLVLPFEHVHDDRFEVSPLDVGFPVSPAVAAEIIQDDVDILIVAVGDDRRRPARFTHAQLHATEPGPQLKSATTCSERHWRVFNYRLLCVSAGWRSANAGGIAARSRCVLNGKDFPKTGKFFPTGRPHEH
jgi:hypothetical protein